MYLRRTAGIVPPSTRSKFRSRPYRCPVISAAAMLGAFGYLATGEVMSGSPFTASVAVGGLMMLALLHIADSRDVQWIREWALGTAMIVGLFAGVLTQVTLGGLW
ncbi:DUF5058 family protein [Natronococcus amylolyticus]|uniref:DUF5058 family protein n=1 Tax=Natronococcus amylolyticus TaxID=44470 RepID=UPI0030843822